jgi:hypothetical protein
MKMDQERSTAVENQLARLVSELPEEEMLILEDTFEIRNRVHDKRRYPRKPYLKSIEYVTENGTGRDILKDISMGGVFLEVAEFNKSFYVGQQILVNIPDPEMMNTLRVNGRICRICYDGVGVRFSLSSN